ncbi:hypothetical protein [Clostridium pasteurianum]|uniref:Uncharacterized protein n=1 Tax=Clostridium pasteurianum BC1 TaxID=86416 RepID=R4JWH2_CLOPA|nr:hypothetical protein [Clostridium pasteurianum]AGK95177.1 hypothetical protein Clopa_0077 [Clostridium pasteurianum BC1]
MPIKVIPTDDLVKLNKQIKALESIIPKDTPKDKGIHQEALEVLLKHREKLLKGEIK